MRKLGFPALVAALLVAMVIAACNGGGGSSSVATSSPPPNSTTAATEAPTSEPGGTLTTEEIVRKLRPSVVQVLTDIATRDIFGELQPSQGLGTGVIMDTEGHIITNDHVVRAGGGSVASRITVTLADGRTTQADVVGTDPQTDLAVLKIDLADLQPAELGDASSLPVGADVVAIGYALGLKPDPTVTRGVVSAKDRTIQEQQTNITINRAIQTDASINPGNSGGPLVDDRGRVVGINTAIIGNAQNIGFAISVDLVKPIVRELIDQGQVRRGFLGVTVAEVTPSLARNLDLPVDEGVGIVRVQPGSPADDAGLQADDIIVGIEDTDVKNTGGLLEALRRYRAGDDVTVRFYRDGSQQETQVTLREQPG